jgi:hypothetical protein
MDGRGRSMDHVFIERPWRLLKCENFHLHRCVDVPEAKAWIGESIGFCHTGHLHQSLSIRTSMAIWGGVVSSGLGDSAVRLPSFTADALSTHLQPYNAGKQPKVHNGRKAPLPP